MKIVIVGVIVILIAVGVFVVSGSDESTETSESASANSLTSATIDADVANGALFIDVRTAEEYADGHATAAELFPLQTMQAGTLPDVSPDTKVYLYCRSGNRSAQATQILKQAGFTDVVDLGGLSDVQSLGVSFSS